MNIPHQNLATYQERLGLNNVQMARLCGFEARDGNAWYLIRTGRAKISKQALFHLVAHIVLDESTLQHLENEISKI